TRPAGRSGLRLGAGAPELVAPEADRPHHAAAIEDREGIARRRRRIGARIVDDRGAHRVERDESHHVAGARNAPGAADDDGEIAAAPGEPADDIEHRIDGTGEDEIGARDIAQRRAALARLPELEAGIEAQIALEPRAVGNHQIERRTGLLERGDRLVERLARLAALE